MQCDLSDHSRKVTKRHGSVLTTLLVLLVLLAGVGGGGFWAWKRSQEVSVRPDLIVDRVSRGPFDHIVLEPAFRRATNWLNWTIHRLRRPCETSGSS
jgi:hypothetical protein